MKQFLLFCSGANFDVLDQCPTEKSKYAGIGATILLTSILASLSGGYALFTVFQSIPAAVILGALWGVVIFNLDRVIVSGMRKQQDVWMDMVYAMPRVILSILLAIVISRPLELRLFEEGILRKWHRMELEARNSDKEVIAQGDTARIAVLVAENKALEKEIQDRYQEFKDAEQSWMKEKEGTGGTLIPGAGPVFAEKEQIMKNDSARMRETEERNRPRIKANLSEIDRIRIDQDSLRAQTERVHRESSGLLERLDAFAVLKQDSRSVHLASIFITLLFIALETAPVTVKLLSTFNKYRPYDELLAQREFEIVEKVKQDMRIKGATLKFDADLEIADHEARTEVETLLSTERNQLRREAETQANDVLMQQVKDAQVEIAGKMVDRWKRRELEKIEQGVGAYALQTS